MELHNVSNASQAEGSYLNVRRSVPTEFTKYDTSTARSNQNFQGLSHSGSLYAEQSLALAFEDMSLSLRTRRADSPTSHRNVALTNGHCPSGRVDVILNQPHEPATLQDESMPLQFSAARAKQKTDELTAEHQEQAYSFPSHLGSFSSSGLHSFDSNFGIPCYPSTASASPIQKQCYVDGQSQSQMYAPYDQHVSSNLIWQHDMGAQPYSVMQQFSGFDVPRHRSNQQAAVCTPANGSSSYLGTPSFHGLESGDPYLNGAAFQKRKKQLNNTYADRFPSTSYTDSSYGSGDFRHFQQPEKVAHQHGLCFSQHQISGKVSTISYPEKILVRPDGVNSVRTTKFAPSVNGCADMDQRINGYGHDHLYIQSNDSSHFDWLDPHFLSSESKYGPSMESPKSTYNSIDEVVGRICIVAKDQNSCRFLQSVFTGGSQEDAEKVFAEIIDHIGELMVDPFAHYLVQKILEECSHDQRMRIIFEITKVPVELLKVSCNMHGTRVVQKVIETLNTSDQALKVVSALRPGAMHLMTDPHGSHVVQRCLQQLLPEHKAFLLEAAASHHLQLATDRHGCCVLQKCIEHSNDSQKYSLLSNIISDARRISEDQYGNYVIQFILNLKIEWATVKVVDALEGHFGTLSMQKCGSHVVEYCLKLAPQLVCDRVINELMNDPKLPHIMLDQYGNYVIQTALKQCKGALYAAFVEAIRPHAAVLQSNMFGKRVLSRTYLKNRQY
ncbi:pumilio homolog 12-like [Phragmites australis]|uniref:pumilio homolog 12-like n=1 Tax=Phragmites australis TaxID=29695 RepID=UPI002D79E1A1|nr:pumilio homolog 12-like [Phragmites australis]